MRLFDLQMTPKEIERAVTLGWGSALLCSVGSLLVAFMLPGFGVPPSEATVIRPAMGLSPSQSSPIASTGVGPSPLVSSSFSSPAHVFGALSTTLQ